MSEGFLLNPHMAVVFFRCCRMFGIEDYIERLTLVRKMVKRHKAKYLRDPQSFIEGKKIMKLGPPKNES